jgi:hypothetical protein
MKSFDLWYSVSFLICAKPNNLVEAYSCLYEE